VRARQKYIYKIHLHFAMIAIQKKMLNLGCGTDIRAGYVNLDRAPLPGVDVVHDLDKLPLPLADASFDHVEAKDVFEHVAYIPLLREVHRILKPNGTLTIQVPHFSSASNYIDPTHQSRFSIRTLEFFVSGSGLGRDYYFDFAFAKIVARRITFGKGLLVYNYPAEWFVNLHPKIQQYYELTFMCALFPAENIQITLSK
jgi:SAM-dependent methyltransferase